MNIKELLAELALLFENGRLYTASVIDSYEHNKCIDRIEDAVTKRIEELETAIDDTRDTTHQGVNVDGVPYPPLTPEQKAYARRITELEKLINATYNVQMRQAARIDELEKQVSGYKMRIAELSKLVNGD